MLRSKSRSGSIGFGQKNHYSSVFSRTVSASKLCRGGALVSQIDPNALKSSDKKPSKNRVDKTLSMEQETGHLEGELHRTRDQLAVAEVERDQALVELREAKEEAHKSNMRVSQALSPRKVEELTMELNSLKRMLANSQEELKVKDNKIKSLELECGKTKQFVLALAERDESINKLKGELRSETQSKIETMKLLTESERKIQELEVEVKIGKESESKMIDSSGIKSKQLEQMQVELEESKREITFLCEKIELLQDTSKRSSKDVKGPSNKDSYDLSEEEVARLMFQLHSTKETLARTQEDEKKASLKAKNLLDEMELLKNEMKLAIAAEEKSAKAMEDLALALKEVTTEANQTKELLSNAQLELEQLKGEAEHLKAMIRSSDERHQKLLDKAKQEAELQKNTADRLRLEAEESVLAWNGKEMGFVTCIKRAEEETAVAQHENGKLAESLEAAEHMARAAKEETNKLRDILKQAISEANVAKAAADIARDENSQLKDCLSEKDEALNFLTQEHKSLRINEAAACENVKELKKLLSIASTALKMDDKEQHSVDKEHEVDNMKKYFSFNLEDLKFMKEYETSDDKLLDEDPEKAEALKGSIFDTNAETPRSEPHTPKPASSNSRGYSLAFTEDGGVPNSEDPDHLDGTHDDPDRERNSHRRRKTMLWRVGDLLMIRRSFHRKETSTESAPGAHKKEMPTDSSPSLQKKDASTESTPAVHP